MKIGLKTLNWAIKQQLNLKFSFSVPLAKSFSKK